MNVIIEQLRSVFGCLCIALVALAALTPAHAGTLIQSSSTPFGTFAGIEYLRHSGRFVGSTTRGAYRVPYEIVAPGDPHHANGTVVFEAPHFLFGPAGRDSVLGPDLLFERRFSHASVGYSNNGFSLLDPFVGDAMVAGQAVIANSPPFLRDVEIMKQFVEALTTDPTATDTLGQLLGLYAYGLSQSAEALNELFYGPGAEGVFDLVVMHVPVWRPPFARPDVLATLPDPFVPLPDIGKVMLVSAEGDLLISQSMQLRNATADPNYRVYEVAGAPHFPLDIVVQGVRLNPLDVAPVVRAAFVAGHRWVEGGVSPPANLLLDTAGAGEIDPVYMFATGIARDINGNAAGGVRFPDVANGRAFHLASALDVEVIPGLAGLVGFWFDLACAALPGDTEPRFRNHGNYVSSVATQARQLQSRGYLLTTDANALIGEAAGSDVGKPGSCGP